MLGTTWVCGFPCTTIHFRRPKCGSCTSEEDLASELTCAVNCKIHIGVQKQLIKKMVKHPISNVLCLLHIKVAIFGIYWVKEHALRLISVVYYVYFLFFIFLKDRREREQGRGAEGERENFEQGLS